MRAPAFGRGVPFCQRQVGQSLGHGWCGVVWCVVVATALSMVEVWFGLAAKGGVGMNVKAKRIIQALEHGGHKGARVQRN